MTPIEVRPARAEDKNAVVAFCQNTFSWGDYIPEVYDTWLADARGTLLVALIDHQPVGLLHAEFLDRGVAWLSGMRVHPDFRRQGVGSAADAVARSLGRARGCRVARLATNIKNIPAQQILAKEGYTCIVRFNEWEAKPARRAFSAARVAKPDHAPAILDAWRAWATREPNPALLVDRNWRWLELNEARLRDQIDAGEVRVGDGGFAFFAAFDEKDWSGINIQALVGDEETMRHLALAARGEAKYRGYPHVEAMLVDHAPLNAALTRAGYRREGGMFIYEQVLE